MMLLPLQQYRDRIEAGQMLARQLAHYASRVDTLVLALPRGGVPIAAEVADYLNAPMDVFLVRKLGVPGNPEVAMGAIASGGLRVLDEVTMSENGVTRAELATVIARETAELERRERLYRGNRPPPAIAGRLVIVVDDGFATGISMHAAIVALHRREPAWLVAAAPVGSDEACEDLAQEVHEIVCPMRPSPFRAVGLWYDHFAPIDDDEVRVCLRRSAGLQRP